MSSPANWFQGRGRIYDGNPEPQEMTKGELLTSSMIGAILGMDRGFFLVIVPWPYERPCMGSISFGTFPLARLTGTKSQRAEAALAFAIPRF